jgi:glyoxylate utilization-related uncharacterized protein
LKRIKADEGVVYDAPNHFGMWGMRKCGSPEGAKAVNVSISEFLPNGGATMSSPDKERVYCVLRGSITVAQEDGAEHRVDADDMIYIAPGEKRSVRTSGSVAARVLVIVVDC